LPSVAETQGVSRADQHAIVTGSSVAQWLVSRVERVPGGPWARRRRAAERARLIDSVSSLAAELAAGQPPAQALVRASADPPVWPIALAAVRLSASVPDALRADAERQPLLRSLAACWEVAESSGSGLSTAIDRLAVSARRAEEVRVQLQSELAAPRATSRLLAVLPAFGLGIAMALGIDPVSWLTGSMVGWACLVSAIALMAMGLVWTNRIAAAVERRL